MTRSKLITEKVRPNWNKRVSSGLFEKKGVWYIEFYFKGRRIRERIAADKKLAEVVLKKRQVAIAEDKFLDKPKKRAKIRFSDLCDKYLETYSKPEKRSYSDDVYFVKRFKQYFGNRYIHEITTLQVAEYKAERKSQVKEATVNRELGVLKSIFNRGIEWDMAETNPVKKVKLFKVDNARLRFLSEEEIKKLLAYCSDDLYDIVMVALNTGMRRGEILGMTWEDVNLKATTITIPAGNAKNKCSRDVPINTALMKVFCAIKINPKSAYVFCHEDGRKFMDIKKSYKQSRYN